MGPSTIPSVLSSLFSLLVYQIIMVFIKFNFYLKNTCTHFTTKYSHLSGRRAWTLCPHKCLEWWSWWSWFWSVKRDIWFGHLVNIVFCFKTKYMNEYIFSIQSQHTVSEGISLWDELKKLFCLFSLFLFSFQLLCGVVLWCKNPTVFGSLLQSRLVLRFGKIHHSLFCSPKSLWTQA